MKLPVAISPKNDIFLLVNNLFNVLLADLDFAQNLIDGLL